MHQTIAPQFGENQPHNSATTACLDLCKKPTVLLAEINDISRQANRTALFHYGFAVIETAHKSTILSKCSEGSIDCVIIGAVESGKEAGLEIARQIRTIDRNLPIIFMAVEPSEDLAIAALRAGVSDYLKQPCVAEDLLSSVERHLVRSRGSRSAKRTRKPEAEIPEIIDAHRMIGESRIIHETRAAIGRIAVTDSNVLIIGETGTGKELVAELIHKNSTRAHQPFVCINCAAIPDSLFESELFGYEKGSFTGAYSASKGKLNFGEGGTIFLDEIGDMTPYAQAKILRVIESREVQRLGGKENIPLNVRFVAATNRDLEQSVAEKTFRKDLFYRLNVMSIHLPLLNERKEDLPALCDHYIGQFNLRFGRRIEGLSQQVAEALLLYDWPGNVRELKNLLEATVGNYRCSRGVSSSESCGRCSEPGSSCRQISFADLPEQFRRRLDHAKSAGSDDRYPLLSALMSTNWNVSKAAEKLKWSRMTIYRKMAKYQIHRNGTHAVLHQRAVSDSGS